MSPTVHKYFAITVILFTSSTTANVDDCDPEVEAAISRGDLETVQRVLERATNNSIIEKRGGKIACIAAERGNLNIIEYIAARNSTILETRNEDGDTIGHIAAEHGHPDIVEYFIKTGPDQRSRHDDGKSFFDKAARRGHLKVIQCLSKIFRYLEAEQYVSISKLAADWGHLDIACYTASIEPVYCQKFKSIIESAIQNSQKRDKETLELVLKLATKWEQPGYCPNIAPLAYRAKDTKVIQYLAENRCTHFVKTADWQIPKTPMQIAFKQKLVNQKFLQCLEANGVLHEKFGSREENIGHVAAEYGRLDVIQFLAEKNASVLAEMTSDVRTVANIAHLKECADIVQCVLRAIPLSTVFKIWRKDRYFRPYSTVFHLAMNYGYLDMDLLKYLVEEKRVPLTKTDDDGETVAHVAAETGDMEKLQYLVEKDPSTLAIQVQHSRKDHPSSRNTVLHILATKDILSEQCLKFFVDKGAPLTVQNRERNTVGHILAKNGQADLVKYLVQKEPSILHIPDGNDDTLCHILAKKNLLSVRNLEFFAEKGASLVSIAPIAAENGNFRILEYVMEKEPSLFVENARLVVEISNIAAERGHSNVLRVIAEKAPAFLLQRLDILFQLPNPLDVSDTLRHLKTTCETKIPNWDRRPFENEVLRFALEYDYPDVLRCMKYNVNMVNDQGEPLIFTAIRRQRRHIFHYLATDGQANLTALDREGNNILFVAAMNGDLEKITYILGSLRASMDIEWRNKAGDSLLHVAVYEALEQYGGTHDTEREASKERLDKLHVIKYLIEHRDADVNARGHGNKTVLQVARARGNEILSKYLLDHGADPKHC